MISFEPGAHEMEQDVFENSQRCGMSMKRYPLGGGTNAVGCRRIIHDEEVLT